MDNAIDLLRHTYGLFGFPFTLELSTRPEKYLGEVAVWDEAEAVCLLVSHLKSG